MSNDLLAGKRQFIRQLAEKLEASAAVKTIYGDPIDRGDMTIIPVAKILYGFGGGEGEGNGQGGAGGGGGIKVVPIGYIELKNGESKFQPIRSTATTIALLVAGGVTGVLLMRGLRSFFQSNHRESQPVKTTSET